TGSADAGRGRPWRFPSIAETAGMYRHWWAVLLLGLFSIVAGITVLAWPGTGVVAIGLIVGILLVVTGIGELAWASMERRRPRGRRGVVVLGIVDLVAGLVAIVWPGIPVLALALIFGIYMIVFSVPMFAFALSHGRGAREHRAAYIATAVGVFLTGVVTVVWP